MVSIACRLGIDPPPPCNLACCICDEQEDKHQKINRLALDTYQSGKCSTRDHNMCTWQRHALNSWNTRWEFTGVLTASRWGRALRHLTPSGVEYS